MLSSSSPWKLLSSTLTESSKSAKVALLSCVVIVLVDSMDDRRSRPNIFDLLWYALLVIAAAGPNVSFSVYAE